ncbi:MAG: cupin domain-containing protein [Planctomycetes bacterium]|nr:cupin domain-containing protein [Planctomycetota bacterium]MBI3833513.1 cupin domain-containing protein [Planctomycetota bacterium]
MLQKINIAQKLSLFSESWSPKIVGEVNDTLIKLVKFTGEFVWHHHEREDEMFFVIKGSMRMMLRDGEVRVNPGEFIIIPRGLEHKPVAEEETHVMLIEPKTVLNTGNVTDARTLHELDRI